LSSPQGSFRREICKKAAAIVVVVVLRAEHGLGAETASAAFGGHQHRSDETATHCPDKLTP
jgi:hypothetical protein